MKKIIYLFILLSIFSQNGFTQTQQWAARYTGPGNGVDKPKAIAVDNSGNVYVTGESTGSGSNLDFATVKYNSNGVQQWVARYNGPGNSYEYIGPIAIDNSGNCYITGGSWGGSSTRFDLTTIKYNSAGVQQWVSRYNGPNNKNDIGASIALDSSGNIYVTGSTNYIYEDFITVKYDPSGNIQWVKTFNNEVGFSDEAAVSLALDASANVFVTGYSVGGNGSYDYLTVKYSSSGNEEWFRSYEGVGGGDDMGMSVTTDASGNCIMTGYASETGGFDYVTIKYNSAGTEQWLRKYNSPLGGGDFAYSVVSDNSGNLIVTGNSYGSSASTGNEYVTVKYNSAGTQQWTAKYNNTGNGFDGAWDVCSDASGNVYVTGESNASGTQRDFATVKYNSSGVQQWVKRYNGPSNSIDAGKAIAVDAAGNVYVTGESTGSGTGLDYATIKYKNDKTSRTEGQNFLNKLNENFPNPFNPSTSISFDLASESNVSLKVYDMLGNEVAVLVNDRRGIGSHSVQFNASDLSSGIYFYKLVTDSFTETKKMILAK